MSGSKSRNAALASFSTPDHGNSPPRMTLTTPKHMDGAAVDPIEKSSSLTSAQEIIAARGRALGVRSGAALAKYVQEEEAAQRRLLQEEEAAQRRLLQEEEEAQLRKEEAQLRKEEAQRRLQREEQDAQRRLQREEEEIRRKVLREEEENDRRRRLAELEEERVRAEIEKTRREETTSSSRSRAIEPVRLKIDPFDEAKEDLDTFLGRFERAATLSGWDRESDWGARLGALLKGFAADVYLELPAEDAGNFDVIVDALRGSFRWTADSYRSKFRLAAKRGEETFIQFATRLRIWFERWRKAAKKEETYAGIRDLILMEHLMDHVSGDLADFIRQREPANVTEAAELAERFAASKRARKNPVTATGRVEKNTKDIENPEEDSAPVSPVHPNGPFPKRNCYGCGKTGHIRRNCPHSASSFNVRTVTN
ncbi:plectin-like [Littorina saxatilis]|uniref:plectin-like n=1 Tax=Littorina saxatilis TaxID=31220 RepID=UPI0038B4516F